MRVLVFHGYLLRGTGSNVYNARLCAALARAGHSVDLLCQEPRPEELDFVDAVGTWEGGRAGEVQVTTLREPVRVTAWRPDIGRLLPVYVADRYEGFEARTLLECSDAEVEAYVKANVDAVRDVCARARPDVALANHLVMGPAIVARGLGGAVPYAVKVHGSALEYVVKRDPERFLPWAREGLAQARTVLVGSRHTGESLWAAMQDEALPERTRLGPPGVDVAEFRPRDDAAAGVAALIERLEVERGRRRRGRLRARRPGPPRAPCASSTSPATGSVCFIGKLIVSKGIDLLLAAWPLVPEARARGRRLRRLPRRPARAARRPGRGRPRRRPRHRAGRARARGRSASAAAPSAGLPRDRRRRLLGRGPRPARARRPHRAPRARRARAPPGRLRGAGLPQHLPRGLRDGGRRGGGVRRAADLRRALRRRRRSARCWPTRCRRRRAGGCRSAIDDGAVRAIATRVRAWLEAPEDVRAATRAALVATARERFSWEGVAAGVVAAAQGRLVELPPVA